MKASRLQSLPKPATIAPKHGSPFLDSRNRNGSSAVDETNTSTDLKAPINDVQRYGAERSDVDGNQEDTGRATGNDREGLGASEERFNESTGAQTSPPPPPKTKAQNRKRTREAGPAGRGGSSKHTCDMETSGVSDGKWVVTMMVPGRKLWGSSPAMLSQYKRFRRSRQEPQIARDQVYLHARNV